MTMRRLTEILHGGGWSLVVDNGAIRTFSGRGVSDLYGLLTREPETLRGAFVADKVVGKGAAALMVLGGVKEVYADVASAPALGLFAVAGIRVVCREEVPHIVNRTRTGICPVERLCADCRTAGECLPRIGAFLENLP